MSSSYLRFTSGVVCLLALSSLIAYQPDASKPGHLADPFAAGWMLSDTNGDEIVDFISGKVVLPAHPTAPQNAAAADLAARLGYATTGFTPPVVIAAGEDRSDGPRIYVGRDSVPSKYSEMVAGYSDRLLPTEGGVFAVADDVVVLGRDDAALLAAAEAYAARAPYIWRPSGEKIAAIGRACDPGAQISGITYLKGKAGINRAFINCTSDVTQSRLEEALKAGALASVHELVAMANGATVSAARSGELPAIPAAPPAAGAGAPPDAAAGGDGEGAGPARLDLATLYTMRGLFRGTARMPIPSNLDGQLYVPAGAAGIAMANLAARMGLETTGITLPLATPASNAAARDVRSKSVVETSSELGREAERKLLAEDTAGKSEPALSPGEGELHIVDKAFGRQPAVLVRGDEAGTGAALGMLSEHFPNLWETGKEHESLEEIRYDLHRFFSLRSPAGQAAFGLYRLGRWADEAKNSGPVHDVEVKLFTDIADPKLGELARSMVETRLGASAVKVTAGSLHAGTQCCEKLPALHYQEPGYVYQQGAPAFQEDLTIPWEGKRLLDAVRSALPKLKPGEPVKLLARVSEGPQQRQRLRGQLIEMLQRAGAKTSQVQVLCAYKQGVSWLMDDIAPQLKGKPVGALKIEFRKNADATGMRAMFSPARWVHELYPVDEMLAKELGIPLDKITMAQIEGAAKPPTYRVHAYDKSGKEMLAREFTVTTVEQPYNGVMPEYEKVEVDTGWVRMESGATAILDQPHRHRYRGILGSLPQGHAAEGVPHDHGQLSRRPADRVRPAVRHAEDRHSHERARL